MCIHGFGWQKILGVTTYVKYVKALSSIFFKQCDESTQRSFEELGWMPIRLFVWNFLRVWFSSYLKGGEKRKNNMSIGSIVSIKEPILWTFIFQEPYSSVALLGLLYEENQGLNLSSPTCCKNWIKKKRKEKRRWVLFYLGLIYGLVLDVSFGEH